MRHLKTTTYVQMDQLEKLKLISEKTCIPVAELVRMGIDMLARSYLNAVNRMEDEKEKNN